MSAALFAAKLALGPVLLTQARWLKRTAIRLPEPVGARCGLLGEGEPLLRLLVIGDSAAAGVGVADQAQALALPLAHILAKHLNGSVAWQLVAQSGVNTAQARTLLSKVQLEPADVVVTALGVNDVSSQTSVEGFIKEQSALWDDVQQITGARWAVFSGLPPMHVLPAVPQPLRWYLGRCATGLDRALYQWTKGRHLGYCALNWAADKGSIAQDGFHPGPTLYPRWAERLAGLLMQGRAQWIK